MPEHRHVKAGEVENLGDLGIGQKRLEVGRIIGSAVKLHEMGIAVAGGKLHEAELVAARQQPKSFRIDATEAPKSNPAGRSPL